MLLSELLHRKRTSIKQRAKSAGLDFDLDKEDIKRLIFSSYCAYSGVRMSLPCSVTRKARERYDTVSIDRVDNSKGYTKGNVVACCHAINQMKGSIERSLDYFTPEEVATALRNIANKLEKRQ